MNHAHARDSERRFANTQAASWQLLGLSPLLAVSNSVVTALTLGLATLAVLLLAHPLVSLTRPHTPAALRLPLLLILLATPAIGVDLLLQAWSYPLSQSLGLFLPLIATNTLLLHSGNTIAPAQTPIRVLQSSFSTGTKYLLLFLLLGTLRELLGTGALFANLQQLLPFAANWTLRIYHADSAFLLALQPAGAFMLLGCLFALYNLLAPKLPWQQPIDPEVVGSKRARVTGRI